MKNVKRILSLALALILVFGLLPLGASAAEITQAFYFELADMLQWSDVGAEYYYVELYKEGEPERMEEWEGTANNLAAASIIPYSGSYYFTVFAYNGNSIQAAKTSDVFTYTDKTPPVVSWYPYDGVQRSSDAEATVQFDNLDHFSACTYYYAVVDSGAAAPAVDTSGAGITAKAGSDNYIHLTNLTPGAKDIYLVLKDQDGNASDPIKTTIPAYVPPVRTFQVTFDTNGQGTAPAGQTVTEGAAASQPTAPTADGYTFGGWYTDAACTSPYDFSAPVTADITLYAKWDRDPSVCTCNVHCTDKLILETSCAFCRASGNPDDCQGTDTLEGGEFTYQGIVYKITDKYNHDVSVKDGTGVSGNVVIPELARDGDVSYTVTAIYHGAFMDCTGLRAVTIPGSVTKIQTSAFEGCTNLTSATIGNGVTSIGHGAFNGCTSLTNLTIPNSVTNIDPNAFEGCTDLTSITILGSITSISNGAFQGCTSLTSITIPSSVTSIGNNAFQDCTGLTSITIPSGVDSIESRAFQGCTGLTSITIPSSVTSIGMNAFQDCTSLTSIAALGSITSISNGAFQGCTSLTSITIPSGVDSIGNSAFQGCTGLTSITIPSSVTSIGMSAFQGCTSLTSITIPSGVDSIGMSAFQGCTSLTSITIPNGVASIGNSAFSGCTGLASITIPGSVTSIGAAAFQNCSNLANITIPDGVTSIGAAAFRYCTKLTSITIPSSVTTIDGSAFIFCNSLQTVLLMTDSSKTIADDAFSNTPATITHKYVAPSNLHWDGTTLRWDGLGTNYVRYEVKINPISADSGIRPIAKTVYTTDHFYDFSGYISPGTYTVSVTAVLPEILDNSQPSYESSDTVTLEEQRVPPRIEISNIYPVRAGVDSANISFVASMPGTMYYFVTDLIQQNPSIDTSGEGMAIKEGYNLFHPTLNAAIDPTQWQYVYVTFKAADGVLSEITRIDVVGTSRTTHKLTVTADEGGSIDPGSRYVEDGGSITFTITPDSGCKLDTLTLDGENVTSAVVGNQYTLTNVTAAHTIQVSFKSDVPVTACTCETRCLWGSIAAGCSVCTEESISGCMGTPTLEENGQPWRLSDTKAEVGFYGSVNPNVTWKYYYILTDDSTAQPTASDIFASGTSGVYEDPHTLTLTELTAGEKYIHIVLRQEEQDRTTNVLRLTIPAFVKLTLTPSADGGDYDAESNTLTIYGGGTVNFTLNAPGYVHCDNDETIEATPVNGESENATEWTVTLPSTLKTYTFYYGLGGQTAACTVVVEEAHTHSYSTDWSKDASGHWHKCSCGATSDFASHTSSGAATEDEAEVCTVCGYEISPKLTHIHKYGPVNYDAASHWFECSCGAKSSEFAHIYEFECTAKCSTCDYERLATHVYEGTALDDVRHELRCKYCDIRYQNSNLSNAFNHEYDDDCDSVCDICGYERTDAHNYEWIKDAEGHEEKCSVCGDVMVAKTAHTSSGAATDDTPETCIVCGYEIAPKLESTLTIVYNDTDIGGELAYHPGRAIYSFPTGTVVDLSDYWPEKREYTVDGETYSFWNFTPNAGHGNILTSVTLNQDTTVYACWVTTGNMHAITFDATGGSVVPKKIVDRNLSLVNDNVPTRHGYEFLGWSLENDGTPDDLMGYRLTSDCTLYATWQRIHNISADWSYDEETHYHNCDCGERHDESEHSYYITKKVCYKCGYVQGMAIGSADKTSVKFVPVTGTTLPEGSYLDVKAYEVVGNDVETIFKATVTDGVSNVTEIIPETKGTISDDGWVFSDQYTLRMGDKVTIGGVTYIVTSYEGGKACLISGGEEYYLDKDAGLYKTGYRFDSYSTDTELISIDGVQYVTVCRITSGDFETVYFTTTEGKAAGHYLVDKGEMSHARFYSDCTPEALTPKVSVGGVVAVADGQFLVNTASGVKVANTIWANNIGLYGADGLPVTGVSGTLTVSGIQYAATKSTIAAHIGAQGVDVGSFDDSIFNIRDVDDFSPFILLEVTDFAVPAITLTGVTVEQTCPHADTELHKDADQHWYVCTACGQEVPDTRAAHSGGTPTCTAQAQCSLCAQAYGPIPGHGDTELRGALEPTCTEPGYTGDKHCKVCGLKLEPGRTVAKTGHDYKWVIDKEATSTSAGRKHQECANCGDTRKENTLIPKTATPYTGDSSGVLYWFTLSLLSLLACGMLLLRRKSLFHR